VTTRAAAGVVDSSEDQIVLRVEELQTYFSTKDGLGKAVDGLNLSIVAGQTVGLVGESGSGKSLTALSIVRLLPPGARISGGRIIFHGRDLLTLREDEVRKYRGRHISMILQDPMSALNPVLTIGDQLSEPLRWHRHLGGRALTERAIELLRLLQIPDAEHRLGSYPHQFSGGMRQRATSAIALAPEPEVIIADEPTTSLDVTVQATFLRLLRDVQQLTGVGILFITHDFGVVARICDRVDVMYAGRIIESATTGSLFESSRHPYTRALLASVPDVRGAVTRPVPIEGQPPSIYDVPGGCAFHPRCWLRQSLGNPDRCEIERPMLRDVSSGHSVACHYFDETDARAKIWESQSRPRSERSGVRVDPAGTAGVVGQLGVKSPLLTVQGVSKVFDQTSTWPALRRPSFSAVDNVSFIVNHGQTTSLVGESGCGKTTTANLVLRVHEPSSGTILYEGQNISEMTGRALSRYQRSIQAVFQDPWDSLNPRMRVLDIIAEPLRVHTAFSAEDRRRRVHDLMGRVGLDPRADLRFPHEFSGGQRQRIAVARALALNPKILVLDEPISSLDVSIGAQLTNLLKDLQQEFGLAYLLIAHSLATVRYLSHDVVVMYLGQVVEYAPSDLIFSHALHPYTIALISASLPARPTANQYEIILRGEVPSPLNPPKGCRFHPRCWLRKELGNPERCERETPALRSLESGSYVACHFAEELETGPHRDRVRGLAGHLSGGPQ
jgi:peptide/nickel transport system ATP-binding protein